MDKENNEVVGKEPEEGVNRRVAVCGPESVEDIAKSRKMRRARRLARWMTLMANVAVDAMICVAISSCSPRVVKMAFPFKTVVWTIIGIGFLCSLLSGAVYAWIARHSDYENNKANTGSTNEYTVMRRLLSSVAVVIVAIFAVALSNTFWPLDTVPETIQKTPFYATADRDRLCTGNLGTVAFKCRTQITDRSYLWICASVEAYGPFDYGGDPGEITMTHLVLGSITRLDPQEVLDMPVDKEILYMKINSYEDGDWIVIKRFLKDKNMIPLQEEQDGLTELWDALEDDEIEYKIFRNPGLYTVDRATDEMLNWDIIDDKVVYSVRQ